MTGLISSESTRQEMQHKTYDIRDNNLLFNTLLKKNSTNADMKVYNHKDYILFNEQMLL